MPKCDFNKCSFSKNTSRRLFPDFPLLCNMDIQTVRSEKWKCQRNYFRFNCYRSSRPELFCKKGVLKNFAKFTGKHLWQSLFFNKVAGLRPATLWEKRLWHRCFPVNFPKFLRTLFLTELLRWLLLLLEKNLFLFVKVFS